MTEEDKSIVKAAASAIMTAQEGNYALWPKGIIGEIKDVPFGAAASILEAIRYYGLLKHGDNLNMREWIANHVVFVRSDKAA